MGRDKLYGALILLFAIIVGLYYTYWAIIYPIMFYHGQTPGDPTTHPWWPLFSWIPMISPHPYFAIAIPMYLAILLILFIVAWIGYTMLTTPPPIPLEEIEEEEESEEESKE